MNRSIRKTLIAMISLSVLFPMLAMSAVLFWVIKRGINDTVIQRNQILSKSIALSIEQQILDASTLLQSVTSELSFKDQPSNILVESSLVSSGIYENVFFINEDGFVIDTIPQNKIFKGFDFSRHTYVQQALQRTTADPVYSPVFISTQTKNPTIMVAVHQRDGVVAAYLNLAWLSRLSNMLGNEQITSLAIVDKYGTIFASRYKSSVEEQYSITNTELFDWAQKNRKGTIRHLSNGYDLISSVSFIPGPDWYVIVTETAQNAFKTATDVVIIGIVVSLLEFFLATLVGYSLGKNIIVSIDVLTKESQQVQQGVYQIIRHRSSYREINRLIDTFNTMSAEVRTRENQYEETNRELQAALQQKDILLREIHHRVKNNMQIVSSLLALQGDELACEKDLELFENSRLRIQSMAMVHEKIYQTDGVESLPLKAYIEDLVELLLANSPKHINYTIDGAEISITLTQAIPCALSVFEACMNGIKYGANGDGLVQLVISIDKDDTGMVRIMVKDSGHGFPEDFNPAASRSLGFTLMQGLMTQLKGNLSWRNDSGAVVEFSFPL